MFVTLNEMINVTLESNSSLKFYYLYFCSNTALAMCGLVQPVFRLPYVPLSRAQREKGAELLKAVANDIPGVKDIRVMEDSEFMFVAPH